MSQANKPKRTNRAFAGSLPGVTLFEILIAVALLGLMLGAIVTGVQAYATIGLRSSSSKLGALISYLAHEAVIKGRPMRLVIDLGSNTYRAEMMADTGDRSAVYLADVEKRKQGENPDEPDEEEQIELNPPTTPAGTAANFGMLDLLKPAVSSRAKPAWEPLDAKGLKLEPLAENVKFSAIYTPQQEQPFTEGQGYLYFWPTGQTEHALIHLSLTDAEEDEPGKFFSIIVDPTTGRAKIEKGRYEFPSDLREFDKPGEEEEEDDDL